jgi:hypothetical protein
MANGTLKVSNIQTSSGSGTITIGQSGETIALGTGASQTLAANTPAWYARRNSSQTISNQTYTKIEFGSEVVDTDSAYDNSTNYRWTCPSGKAGKYYIFGNLFLDSGNNANFEYGWMQFRRNGTAFAEHIVDGRSTNGRQYSVGHAFINDVAVGDYYEIFAYISDSSGSPSIKGGSAGASDGNSSNFGGYKLIGV